MRPVDASALRPPPVGPGARGCAPSTDERVTVIACGFPPGVAPVAVDDEAVYVLTLSRASTKRLHRVELATGVVTELHRDDFSGSSDLRRYARSVHRDGERLFFGTDVRVGGGVSFGIASLPTRGGAPRVLMEFGTDGFGTPLFADDDHLYFVGTDGSLEGGHGVRRVHKSGGSSRAVAGWGSIVEITGGFVYFLREDALLRAPVDGGAEELVAAGLPIYAGVPQVAVDATHYYFGEEGEPGAEHRVHRVALDGGASEVVVTYANPGVSPGPTELQVIEGRLYFQPDPHGLAVAQDGELRAILGGEGELSRPVFDDTHVYTGYERGGYEGPIEGAVVRAVR